MRIACWITKATDTPLGYVIIIPFPPQQWLRERAPLLRYTYIPSLATKLISNVMCVSINKQLINFEKRLGVLSRLCQGKGLKSFSPINVSAGITQCLE